MKSPTESIPYERYIGLDVHKEYVTVGGMNFHQEVVLRPRNVDMRRFRAWAENNLRPTDAVVLEATTNTWDIYDIVAPLVAKTVVAHPPEVKQIANASVKIDKHDVIRLIRLLIVNMVPEVWVPPAHVRELRALMSYRWRLLKMSTMVINRLRSLLHRHNIPGPEGKLYAIKNQHFWDDLELSPIENMRVRQELATLRQLRAHIDEIQEQLAILSNSDPWKDQAVYLMQLPGVGLVVTMTVLSSIGDIFRFPSAKKLVGYAGLGAGVHHSGKTKRGKRITKRGRRELRWALVEAAWRAVRCDPHWKAQFEELKKRKHKSQAIVAIARKMLVVVWHVLSKQEPCRLSQDEDLAYKMIIWSQRLDEDALQGMTRQQFAKYGLLRLGAGKNIERIVRNGFSRRLASAEDVLTLKPELRPPQ
jgi:transposase